MNPFTDPERRALWEMLVERDIRAFIASDWSLVADDFLEDEFYGVDGRRLVNPDGWRLTYPTLESYRARWLSQAAAFHAANAEENPSEALHALTELRDIEISGDRALAHKKFDGTLKTREGARRLCWQTLYHCRKLGGKWKICGFTGYMPNPMGGEAEVDALARAVGDLAKP